MIIYVDKTSPRCKSCKYILPDHSYECAAVCKCTACSDMRSLLFYADAPVRCFQSLGDGHGPCTDPFRIGCKCTGTAADGECEGCWLWGK